MSFSSRQWRCLVAGLLLCSSCTYPVRDEVDRVICDLAKQPIDLSTETDAQPATTSSSPPGPTAHAPAESTSSAMPEQSPAPASSGQSGDEIVSVAARIPSADAASQQPPKPRPLEIPRDLPGADAAPLQLREPQNITPEQRKKIYDKWLYSLPSMGNDPEPIPGPHGQPLTLSELQQMAMSTSPLIREAESRVVYAKGAVRGAAAYPNPNVGLEVDTIGTGTGIPGAGGGYQGAYVEQVIKTAGKLRLATAAATMELLNAELSFRKQQAELAAQVRRDYFAVLVAREGLKISRALARFTDEVYGIQVRLARTAGQTAPYEPVQMRVLATQTRNNWWQARQRYVSAWKQLASTLGTPGMPLTQVAGHIDMAVPVYEYNQVASQILTRHTDVLSVENSIRRARYNLQLARVTPVPDVDFRFMVQKDWTTPPFMVAPSVVFSVPVPVWYRNQGGILQAQSDLLFANEEAHRVRNDLARQLADAFERYNYARTWVYSYRDEMLPDQIRVYRAIYARRQQLGDVTFADLINAQQILGTAVADYIAKLGVMWGAVADISQLLQTNDLFQTNMKPHPTEQLAQVPDLEQLLPKLLPLPCHHPCTPAPNPAVQGVDGSWSAGVPERKPPLKPDPEQAPMPRKQEKTSLNDLMPVPQPSVPLQAGKADTAGQPLSPTPSEPQAISKSTNPPTVNVTTPAQPISPNKKTPNESSTNNISRETSSERPTNSWKRARLLQQTEGRIPQNGTP